MTTCYRSTLNHFSEEDDEYVDFDPSDVQEFLQWAREKYVSKRNLSTEGFILSQSIQFTGRSRSTLKFVTAVNDILQWRIQDFPHPPMGL